MADIPDPVAKEMVDKITDDKPSKKIYKNFIKFLVDFNVIGYTSAFLIALSITKITDKITIILQKRLYNKLDPNGVILDVIFLFIMTALIYIFIEFFFYKYLYTKELSTERKVEKVLDEKNKKDIEKNANNINKVKKTLTQYKYS